MKTCVRCLSVFLACLLILQTLPLNARAMDAIGEALSAPETEEDARSNAETAVLSEITDLRGENEKTFQLANGNRYAVSYAEEVHFRTSDGTFTEYDNTLTEIADAQGRAWVPAANDASFRIAAETGGESLISVEKDGYALSWTYENIKKSTAEISAPEKDDAPETLEKMQAEARFNNVFKDTDLQYILSGSRLKENLILKSARAPGRFALRFAAEGLSPVLSENGRTIALVNAAGETVLRLEAPFAADAAGAAAETLYYEITEIYDGGFSACLCLDEAWLSSNDRAFPVTVDPVLLTKTTFSASGNESSYVASATPNTSYGYGGLHYEGSLYTGYTDNRGKMRSFIKFTLPTLATADRVVRANMYLFLHNAVLDMTVTMHRVLGNWNETTITWNNKPSCDTATVSDYQDISGAGPDTFITWDITKAANDWYSGTPNYGVMLMTEEENYNVYNGAWFFSTAYTTGYTGVRPVVTVEYRNMSGYESYYTYLGAAAGRGGEADVNLYNGNLVASIPVTVDNGGARMPVQLSLVYNANKGAPETGLIGIGWKLNYQICIRPNPYLTDESTDAEKKYKYYFEDADGTQHYFYFENLNGNTGKDEDGLGFTLTVGTNQNDPPYTVTDKDGGKMEFNGFGNLIHVRDTNGNSIDLTYDTSGSYNRLRTVKDGAGRTYTLVYYENWPTVISLIKDPSNRITKFHTISSYLTAVDHPDTANQVTVSTSFTYTSDTPKVLSGITGPNGVTTNIAYSAGPLRRVTHLSNTSGGLTADDYSFAYAQNETAVTDCDGHSVKYQFNYFGQTTGIVSADAEEAAAYSYEAGNSTSPTANRLKLASRVQKAVDNYAKNPGFRTGTSPYWIYKSVSSDASTLTYDGNFGHYANGSLKITHPTGAAGYVLALQNVYVPAGTYTFSAYVSLNGAVLPAAKAAPMLSAEVLSTSAGHLYSRHAEKITSTGAAGEWVRQSVTVSVEEGQYLRVQLGLLNGAHGTAWFDDIQVESGAGESAFNIIENPQFKTGDNANWVKSASAITLPGANSSSAAMQFAALPGNTDAVRTVSQTVPFKGAKGQVFSFGAWAQGTSVPTENDKNVSGTKQASMQLQITLLNGNSEIKTETLTYNPHLTTKQFASGRIAAPGVFTQVKISFIYGNNANTASVSGFYVLAEEYGETYFYDSKGNLVSAAGVEGAKNAYGYTGTDLSTAQGENRTRTIYGVDETTKNLKDVLNTESQHYVYNYDSYGNMKYAAVKPAHFTTSVTANETYYIVNAETGKMLTVSGSASPYSVVNGKITSVNDNAKWLVEAVPGTTGEYRLQANDHYLTVNNASGGFSAMIAQDNATPANPNRTVFKFFLNNDGTFTIKTKISNYGSALDAHTDTSNPAALNDPVRQNTISDKEAQKWYLFGIEGMDDYMKATATYTSSGNFVATANDVNNVTTQYAYDSYTGQLQTATDALSHTTTYAYDAISRPTSVARAGMSAAYTYASDRLSAVAAPGGTTYAFTYDALGRLTASAANGVTLASTTYDSKGRVTAKTSNGETVQYTYDPLDRPASVSYNGSSLGYYYGADGKPAQTADSAANEHTRYVYDLAGRAVQTRTYTGVNIETNTLKSALEYTYENASNRVSAVRTVSELGTNTLGVTYGDLSNAQSADIVYAESWNGDPAKSYTYDDLGRLSTNATHTSGGADLTASYTYKLFDTFRSSMLVSEYSSGEGYAYFYEYDDLGNITSETRGNKTTSYEYNEQGMLIRENNERAQRTWVYTYPKDGDDQATSGNILSRKTYEYTTAATPANLISTDTFTYGNSAWGDLLTGCGNKTITYSGTRPVTYGDYSLSWYRGGLLSGFSKSGDVNTYTYDVSGRRLTKAHNGTTTTFIYAGDLLLGQKTGTETITFQFDSAGNYFGFTYDGDDYYYVKDLQGDVVAISDTDGFVIVRYYYDAWGRLLSTKDYSEINLAQINPIRYRGYYYDTETGLYFLQSRYYDPEICRFISADNQISSKNVSDMHIYAYCKNNPISFSDPSGTIAVSTCILIGAVIVGAANAAYTGYKLRKAGANWSDTILYSAAAGLGVFDLVFSGGMLVYDSYCAISYSCGYTPVTEIGTIKATTTNSAYTTGSPYEVGRKGEDIVGINQKEKVSIFINNRTRIPDQLKDGILTEVKNVKYLSNTCQLRDFADYAEMYKLKKVLYVRPDTYLTQSVKDAGWDIRYLW